MEYSMLIVGPSNGIIQIVIPMVQVQVEMKINLCNFLADNNTGTHNTHLRKKIRLRSAKTLFLKTSSL